MRFGFTTRIFLGLLAFSLISALLPADQWSSTVAPGIVESAREDVELGQATGQTFCSRTAFAATLSPTQVQAGQVVTARAQGYHPNSTVTLSIKGPVNDTLTVAANLPIPSGAIFQQTSGTRVVGRVVCAAAGDWRRGNME